MAADLPVTASSTETSSGRDSEPGARRGRAPAARAGLVVALTALAVAVRLAWVLLVPTHPVGDFAMYWEAAAHLVEHGALDPQFIYMPGYVAALALIQALGGGLLASQAPGRTMARCRMRNRAMQ